MISVDEGRCTGCGVCVGTCPTSAISVIDGAARIDESLCRECEAYVFACPTGAISAVREPSEAERSTLAPPHPVARLPQLSGSPRLRLSEALGYISRGVVPQVWAFLRNREQPRPVSQRRVPTIPWSWEPRWMGQRSAGTSPTGKTLVARLFSQSL